MTTAMAGLGTGETLTVVDAAVAARRGAEVSVLHSAAHWADLHGDHEGVTRGHGATDEPGARREHPVFRRWGGEGTPVVAQFATAELAVSLGVHPESARRLIADALDLRHRLSPLWQLTCTTTTVEVWVLRRIAALTRHLTPQSAHLIATDLVDLVGSLPTGRLLERLEALVLLAETAEAEAAADAGSGDSGPEGSGTEGSGGDGAGGGSSSGDERDEPDPRFVTFNPSTRRGFKGLYAKLTAAEAIVGDAQVQRLAEKLLATDLAAGVPRRHLDSISVARSRALGLLIGSPESALAILADSTEPVPSRARATTIVHLHLSEDAVQAMARASTSGTVAGGVAKIEGHGPTTLAEALAVLRLTEVSIRPVLDPWATRPVDSYAFTGALREAVLTRSPADCYPHAVNTTHHMDIDHTIPYDPHGPPGQTRIDNAGPMSRHHHRIKTAGVLALRQPVPDLYVWRTRHHRYRLVDQTGTHHLPAWLGALVFSDHHDDHELAIDLLTTGDDHGLGADLGLVHPNQPPTSFTLTA
ncbi:hypothetical protein ncot_08580 [Nocardioides sp. JQ2195]|uniref:DUF222 domain-containing protein n=1 Tax=Nocardioides sp. JQ2195 TaxID=2592334 RepID=UPI00143ED61F|nr:hypothetical protein [Nocardioides sp. JQ2195]QIX26653.1 hypothetical protein ncot_08580 [Nocardioides sp. JQ2195]